MGTSEQHRQQPHFVLIPLMCPGHLIPSVDLARLLANHQAIVTIVTTTLNATRFSSIIEREINRGLPIRLLTVAFPASEVGLPEGVENIDTVARDHESMKKFFVAASMLQQPIEKYLEETEPNPCCMISDRHLPWTVNICSRFKIPRLIFNGMSCFNNVCTHHLTISRIYEKYSCSEPFVVPGLPDRIELTRAKLPLELNKGAVDNKELGEKIKVADMASYGIVINTFEELESAYIEEYRKIKGGKVWCVGPVSLCNNDKLDKAERGNKAAIDESRCLKWLDSWPPTSVVYACLGTLSRVPTPQMIEFGLGLEKSNRPFIWATKGREKTDELKKWASEEGFEERIKGRGILIWGWAPQVMILSHPAVGAFITHCGWNSVMEGVCAGIPMITWPFFADQFFNEISVTQLLRIGEKIGVEIDVKWGEEDKYGVVVKRDQIMKVVDMVMDEGKQGEERRARARTLAEIAKKSTEVGGSSYLNVKKLISDMQQDDGKEA